MTMEQPDAAATWRLDYRDSQNRARIDIALAGGPAQQVMVLAGTDASTLRRRGIAALAEGGSVLRVEVLGMGGGVSFGIAADEVPKQMEREHAVAKAEQRAQRGEE